MYLIQIKVRKAEYMLEVCTVTSMARVGATTGGG